MENTPTGFRFYPTEEELVSFYLRNKLRGGRPDIELVIPVVNIYLHSPWELPQLAGVHSHGNNEQWFYFIPGPENIARGGKPNRLTNEGYWKATGSPAFVYSSNNQVIGEKRTMAFYTGRAPNGTKTEWKINEYKAVCTEAASSSTTPLSNLKLHNEFSLCRLYKKSKCDRAFDRRPLDISAMRPPPSPSPRQDNDQSTVILLPQDPLATERTSAKNNSSSGDTLIPPNVMETDVLWDNSAPLWDWEDYFNLS